MDRKYAAATWIAKHDENDKIEITYHYFRMTTDTFAKAIQEESNFYNEFGVEYYFSATDEVDLLDYFNEGLAERTETLEDAKRQSKDDILYYYRDNEWFALRKQGDSFVRLDDIRDKEFIIDKEGAILVASNSYEVACGISLSLGGIVKLREKDQEVNHFHAIVCNSHIAERENIIVTYDTNDQKSTIWQELDFYNSINK